MYRFANGLGVGDTEEQIRRAFGDDCRFVETAWKDVLCYDDENLEFEISKEDRTVSEINVGR